ncbi:uncharacterized protein LOC108929672 [Scleropages formosus]|uniref:uncharacterized protein LOC108929672 n=1 Tax=Scleropages formosus TaxID=113540 RepID=UPI00087880F3|nr:uncharacterized protein LOC108929672 [Scleropages formosus]
MRKRAAHFWTQILALCQICFIHLELLALPESLVVSQGENVTFLCSDIMKSPGHVAWFRQNDGTVPLCILSMFSTEKFVSHHNGARPERTFMDYAGSNFVLRIKHVDLSDTGLYFCGMIWGTIMVFNNATFLRVRGNKEREPGNIPTDLPKQADCEQKVSCLPALLGVGAASAILLIVVIILILKEKSKKGNSCQQQQHEETEDTDMVNYAALHFNQNKKKAVRRQMELSPHVVYAATR